MNYIRSYLIPGGMIVLLLQTGVLAKNSETKSPRLKVYSNNTYGFRVDYHGTLVRRDSTDFVIDIPAAAGTEGSGSRAHIFVAQQPFVYLPGTYGGPYYFEQNPGRKSASDRVKGDSVNTNGLYFARDYWVVYAGEGQWETVINCYALTGGHYYVVSLEHDFSTPMPGEIINGSRINKNELRGELIDSLRTPTKSYVASFNEILDSFSVTR